MKSEWLWDRLAGRWDTPGVSLGENDVRIVEMMKRYLDSDSVVLDYGCATGSICFEIAGQVQEVQGLDTSLKMIEIAQRKAIDRQTKNVEFSCVTIFDDRYPKESIDLILAASILHLVKEPEQVVARINELLKPGGIFISATPCLGEKKALSLLMSVPVFLMSRTGLLPHVEFFSLSGLVGLLVSQNFQIVENVSLAGHSITENIIAAKKL